MSKYFGTILIGIQLLFVAASGVYGENESVSLSLNDAVNLAFTNNKDIQVQEEEVEIAKANILGARSGYLPRLNVGYSYTRNGAVLALPSQAEIDMYKDLGVFTGYDNDNQVNLSIRESIYDGGFSIASAKQSRIKLTIQEETLRFEKSYIEFEVKRLYYGLLLAYETRRITEDLLKQAESHYEDVKNKFDQGTSSRFDVLQSKVQVSKIMPELVRAKNAVDLISSDLKKILGLKMNDFLALKDNLSYETAEINEEEFLRKAYANNPEVVLKTLGIDAGNVGISMARASGRLQVDASAAYYYRSDGIGDMFNERHNNWNAGITVTMPLFDGFSTKAKVDEAKAKYEQAVLNKEDINDRIAVDIRKACLDLLEAEAIIKSQRDSVEEAKESLRISEISYENGEGTNLDILDAQVSLSQIEKNLSEGIYDYLMAKAYLDKTMGKAFD